MNRERFSVQSEPRELSPSELFDLASKDLNSRFPNNFSEESIKEFIELSVYGIQLLGVNVIFVAQDYIELKGKVGDLFRAYVSDPRTKAIVLEYFFHDIKNNAKRFPVLGRALNFLFSITENSARIKFANELSFLAQKNQKKIAVMDVANKPILFSASIPLIPALFTNIFPLIGQILWAETMIDILSETLGKGKHSDQYIQTWEKLIISATDARRTLFAAGLWQLAEEYQPRESVENHTEAPQIIVSNNYQHTMRILDHLINQNPFDQAVQRVKRKMYSHYLDLHPTVRQYEWKEMAAKFCSNPELAGWEKISDRPLDL